MSNFDLIFLLLFLYCFSFSSIIFISSFIFIFIFFPFFIFLSEEQRELLTRSVAELNLTGFQTQVQDPHDPQLYQQKNTQTEIDEESLIELNNLKCENLKKEELLQIANQRVLDLEKMVR